MTAISVSCRGDKPYIKALKVVAAQNGIPVADLVRNALDAQYGDTLKSHLAIFNAHSEDKNPHSVTETSKEHRS